MGKGYRQGRLAEEIKKIISDMLLRELKDPRLSAFISISAVEVTKDASYAKCYITLIDTSNDPEIKKQKEEEAILGLNSAKGAIRKEIGACIKLRRVPDLVFKIDTSMEYGRHIDEVIKELENGNK